MNARIHELRSIRRIRLLVGEGGAGEAERERKREKGGSTVVIERRVCELFDACLLSRLFARLLKSIRAFPLSFHCARRRIDCISLLALGSIGSNTIEYYLHERSRNLNEMCARALCELTQHHPAASAATAVAAAL